MALTDKLTAIADAIRAKAGTTDGLTLDAMPTAIEGIETGGGGFPNGTEWTAINVATGYPSILRYGGGVLIANGADSVYYSKNGKTWEICIDEILYALHYANGLWVGAKLKGMCYSNDGITWEDCTIDSDPAVKYINYANGLWTAMGGGFHCSFDGKTWNTISGFSTTESISSSGYFTYYANGLWIASFSINTYYSSDGTTWEICDGLTTANQSILYDAGIWVAGNSSKGLYYSVDGMTWTASNVTSGKVNILLKENGVYVAAVANKGLYYSVDGMTWTASNLASGYYQHVSYADGLWVAGGTTTSTGFYYSLDGKTWVVSNETVHKGRTPPVYNNGVWVFMALDENYNGCAFWSADGASWTQIDGVIPTGDIIFVKGAWFACGEEHLVYSVAWEPT